MQNEYVTKEEILQTMREHLAPADDALNAYSAIEQLPAADVAPVVRCKDCEQYVAGEIGYGKCNFFKTAIFSEFYCRYGGKKGRSE